LLLWALVSGASYLVFRFLQPLNHVTCFSVVAMLPGSPTDLFRVSYPDYSAAGSRHAPPAAEEL
jgi:hypothetical protein